MARLYSQPVLTSTICNELKLPDLIKCRKQESELQNDCSAKEKMTEASKNKIECALANMLNEVDKLHLRHLQAEMHKCAAKCCEDQESSLEFVHACIEICNQNLKKAQKVVKNEFFNLQKRLQGCVLNCNDEVKKTLAKQPLDRQIQQYNSTFDKCVNKCIDSNIALIPLIMKKMKEVLANKSLETKETELQENK